MHISKIPLLKKRIPKMRGKENKSFDVFVPERLPNFRKHVCRFVLIRNLFLFGFVTM
jgi:hypothetical protein